MNKLYIFLLIICIILFLFIIYKYCSQKEKFIQSETQYVDTKNKVIVPIHNYGFFSCCSVKLNYIVDFINLNSKIPDIVDSLMLFNLYKIDKNKDITYNFFENYNNIKDIIINYSINFHHNHQFINYSELDYKNIIPVVKKYFSPSKSIISIIEKIKQKYQIDYNNTIAIYYRGTDKKLETSLATFENYYTKIKEISNLDINKKIIIQTDSTQFIDYINSKNLQNIIIITENSTSYLDKGIHNEKTSNENYNDMLNLFSTFLILSKCKYIICGSGNCSLWMMFYRGNNKHVYQFFNNIWYN